MPRCLIACQGLFGFALLTKAVGNVLSPHFPAREHSTSPIPGTAGLRAKATAYFRPCSTHVLPLPLPEPVLGTLWGGGGNNVQMGTGGQGLWS